MQGTHPQAGKFIITIRVQKNSWPPYESKKVNWVTENKWKTKESKLENTVTYLQFVDSTLDAAKQNEEPQDRPLKQQEEAYLGLPTYQN